MGLILGLIHNVQNDKRLKKIEYFFNYAKEMDFVIELDLKGLDLD